MAPRHAPHSHAPRSASVRAAMSPGSAAMTGRAAASERTPSSAIRDTIGEASGAYRASTAWAMALKPLVTDTSMGRPTVSSGSWTTLRGRTARSRPVRLRPFSVSPHTVVISEPA